MQGTTPATHTSGLTYGTPRSRGGPTRARFGAFTLLYFALLRARFRYAAERDELTLSAERG